MNDRKEKIKSVDIHNFQSHKDTHIDFADFTAIVGPTDSGKSAIIRAIKWCLYNEMNDNNFIRLGCDEVSVKVSFDNGNSVTRSRKSGKNIYLLQSNNESMELTAFGSGPVKEVMDFHKMREVFLFGQDVKMNLHEQHSQPFFLTETPSKKAALLGSLAKTDLIDKAINILSGDIRVEKKALREAKLSLKEVQRKLYEYKDIPQKELELQKALSLSSEAKAKQAISSDLSVKQEQIKGKMERQKNCEKQASREKEVLEQKEKLFEISKKQGSLYELDVANVNIYSASLKVRINKKIYSQKDSVSRVDILLSEIAEREKKLNELFQRSESIRKLIRLIETNKDKVSISNFEEASSFVSEIGTLITSMSNLEEEIQRFKEKGIRKKKFKQEYRFCMDSLIRAEQSYNEFVKENPTCPLCGNKLEVIKDV